LDYVKSKKSLVKSTVKSQTVKSYELLLDLLQFYDNIRDGKLDPVIRILKDPSKLGLLDGFDIHGDSPLHIACRYGHLELVKHFIAIKGEKYLAVLNNINHRNVLDHACKPVEGRLFQRTNGRYVVLSYLASYKSRESNCNIVKEANDMIESLIKSLDKDAIPDAFLIRHIIPGLGLSYERDFGGGRFKQELTIVRVLVYYRELKVFKFQKQMRTRLLLVGAGVSGKTTLAHQLMEVWYGADINIISANS
jgi:hypothetical protein